ncbi:WhiB family transcriptional regulator [Sporichthya polymorpha]|uniref:WhiB family transcriptional regulator n=1 Tax=Sporichthya polymorpha TaxID=35751 RepID=UPI000366ED54|nr:WhiB family transcriptional regulator [Sporichthya polymorpha]
MGSCEAADARVGEWRSAAACAGSDPEIFFPIGTIGPSLRDVARAVAICRSCPVSARCLDWALRSGQEFGVWGGTTEEDRRPLLRGRDREALAQH